MKYNDAFDAGWHCGVFGANTDNCHFTIFSSKRKADLWSLGCTQAKKACKRFGRRWLQILLSGGDA